ncbi:GNAT family N-acetyltransferase [Nocardia brasiliensis]|uniref:GNAT family N-acetyltransferase n=1 Tax=Nocardia brasiliensis TaxID=37326 RepID=UPI0036700B15
MVVGQGSYDEPELAYELAQRAHGYGYATEAARVVVEAAAGTGRRRLWATVREWNAASAARPVR